ncbi:MAG: xanthine dehydrogenase accessory protein XdhC [Pseudomonadota bacterium]|jgi:xanthine dehydrogenase accessory factor
MSLDPREIGQAVADHGTLVRVVIAEVAGSSPREAGAAMLVWAAEDGGGQSGTVGGGALEWEAATRARSMLAAGGAAEVMRLALGPALGQCCGGSVTLLAERWDAAALDRLDGPVLARPLPGTAGGMPLAVRRLLAAARAEGVVPGTRLVHGWLVEAVAPPPRDIWVWGAGHVGRAIVAVLAPLPGLAITWIDTAAERFPAVIPAGVKVRMSQTPGDLVPEAPAGAEHYVLTFSHALDLDLCHRLLSHGFAALGLIGSETKRARFRSRLAALGHSEARISRIACPIGDPALGKHPQAIAVGVAAALLKAKRAAATARERAS